MPTPGIPLSQIQITDIVTALTKLVAQNPKLFRTIWLMVTGAAKSKNPWRFALRTMMAEAAMHASQELANEVLKAKKSLGG